MPIHICKEPISLTKGMYIKQIGTKKRENVISKNVKPC